ncbi:flavodoxin domain-containing protein [Ostreiculturibacter nitratireducens]|uniref:flavodoxin domain-containing protein n=1 Tax=Ostreiculturibacter nitratireducens TaxID=3075226 RepID=UPI0031B5C61D
MKLLIVYGTTEGQTRKVARFAADRLADAGHAVELLQAEDAEGVDLGRFDGVILAGSIHAGDFQKALVAFAEDNAKALAGARTLFLSVSLSAAGDYNEDWAGLDDCIARFVKNTGWTPGKVAHVAGAFRFSEYDFFKSWAMRWIASQKDQTVKAGVDKEYTDWDALGALLDEWVAGLKRG